MQINFNDNYSLEKINHPRYSNPTFGKFLFRKSLIKTNTDRFISKVNKMPKRKRDFWKFLQAQFNSINYYAKDKEDKSVIKKVFELIKKPTEMHFDIVNFDNGNFEGLTRIFAAAKDKKTLKFVKNLQTIQHRGKYIPQNFIIDILESPNKNIYMKNMNDFIPFIKLNKDNKNVIKDLDKKIENNTYDKAYWAKKFELYKMSFMPYAKDIIGNEPNPQKFSGRGIKLLRRIFAKFLVYRKLDVNTQSKNVINEIQNTTTPENRMFRRELFRRFKFKMIKDESSNYELEVFNALFKIADKNEDAKKFIIQLLKDKNNFDSPNEILEILKVVSPKKGKIFHKNISRIIRFTSDNEERKNALKNRLTKNSFNTKREKYIYEKKGEVFRRKLKNLINNIKLFFVKDKNIEIPKIHVDRFVKKEPEKKYAQLNIPKFEHTLKSYDETPVIKLVNTLPKRKSAQVRKTEVINDVRELLKKHLLTRTLKKQESIYTQNATKMRLKLLPEIFASIKETRATDKLVGKNKRNSARTNAVELYKLISGKNLKLVRYMLKKRNIDGTRMFEVKQIIDTIHKAEEKIAKMKLGNKDFKTADAKKYYNHLYDANVQQYGKLK